jgi:hypothetical protein
VENEQTEREHSDRWFCSINVRFGSKADSCSAATHVRFTPNSDRESGHPQEFMSALPPKADIQDGYDRSSRKAIAAMLNMRGRGRFTGSDLVYWLVRRSRTTIQIMVAIISVPPRADASAQ